MRHCSYRFVLVVGMGLLSWLPITGQAGEEDTVYPVALLQFEERDAEAAGLATKVADLLFANLANCPALYLVDREDLGKVVDEQGLGLSGLVAPQQANRIGHLTGAKILVTGSVLHTSGKRYLVAKVIGTETSRVFGTKVQGDSTKDLDLLVEELAGAVDKTIADHAKQLVAPPTSTENCVAALRKRLGDGKRPTLSIEIDERHIGESTIDPAAEIELMKICRELGFEVIAVGEGNKKKVDVRITGEGFSEFASRHGDLVSVKARLELKAVERKTGRVLAADREVSVAIDLAERIAAKTALQRASASIAQRMLVQISEGRISKSNRKR